ncbi:hypothetical protein FK529_02880 [Tsukamurella asaccharolytica]|uniref:Capsular polysaccharide biosynthesis protein n=1 Tax=Tsukamurella asaccharolytica TaxID=2592067 RepID=A0A5C5REX7_9ACTN|nr:hypothetical protein [Tsukamurella asaccharolytica]TWS21547.1 hypothetical protein FK529_02880 [Tsukamurella asaccharolytica]
MNVAGFLRWVLTKPLIIVLVIAAGLAGGAIGWKSTTSHFESTAAVLVIPPGAGSTNAKDNPFTDLDYGSAQIAQVLTVVAQGPRGRAALAAAGASPDVVMVASVGEGNPKQISPLITYTVSAPQPQQAEAGAKALIDFWRAEFRRMQVDAGVVGNTFADLRVPVAPTPGTEVGGNAMRAALGLAMGAALAMLALCLVAAAAMEALKRRRSTAAASTPAADAPTEQFPVVAAAPAAESPALSGVVPAAEDAPSRTVPAAIPIRPPGDAARRAMTRWRDRVEEVPEADEIPLPELDETAPPAPGATTSEVADQPATGAPGTAADAPPGGTARADETADDLELPRAQSAR